MARAAPQAEADSAVIRVSGSAQVSVTPDRARVTFAVETEGETAGAASRANATAMEAVLNAVRAGSFPGLDVETFGYSVSPVYTTEDRDGRRVQRIESYRALNNVAATVSDPDVVGRVIDAAVDAGANRIGGLSFFASDTREARDEALRSAVEQATREARIMAEALGRVLGEPLDVQGGAETPMPRMRAAGMEMLQARADTPIEAGDQIVRAQVSITFALGPGEPR